MRFLRDGFDWTGLTGRAGFAVTFFAWRIFLIIGLGMAHFGLVQTVLIALSAVFLLQYWGHGRRRLRDMGWSGWWLWALAFPGLGLVFGLFMMIHNTVPNARPGHSTTAGVALAWLCAALVASRIFWAPYSIPSGDMKPALHIGDFAVAERLFTPPERGDVLVFRHPTNGTVFVKRLIGLPGETVQIVDGHLQINGTAVPRQENGTFDEVAEQQGPLQTLPRCSNAPVALGDICRKTMQVETLPEGRRISVLDIASFPQDNTPVFTVPEGHYFFLGDNRDNSADSRMQADMGGIGYVPQSNVIGIVRRVVLNLGDRTRIWQRVQ